MTRAKPTRPATGGYILVAVLGVMLLLTGFMAAGSVVVRSALHGASADDEDLSMVGLTRGGLELTAYQLFVRKIPASSVDGRRIRFAGGTIAPRILDEAAKVDLNGADPALLAALLEHAGLDKGASNAVVAWIVELRGAGRNVPGGVATPTPFDVSNAATAPDLAAIALSRQAGEMAAQDQPVASAPRRRGFQSVDQLRDAPGLTKAEFRLLAPRLTVYNPDGKVDIVTASRDVLAAVPGLTSAQVERILSLRGASTREELGAMVGTAAIYTKTTPGPAYAVRVDATARSALRGSLEAVVAPSNVPGSPYLVLDWRDGA